MIRTITLSSLVVLGDSELALSILCYVAHVVVK